MSCENNVSMKHCMLKWKYCTLKWGLCTFFKESGFSTSSVQVDKKVGPTLTFALPQVKYCCLNHRLLHHPEDHEEPWPIVVKYKPGVSSCFSCWTGADALSLGVDHGVDLGVDLGVELGVTSFWSFWFAAIIYSMLLTLRLVRNKPRVSSCYLVELELMLKVNILLHIVVLGGML